MEMARHFYVQSTEDHCFLRADGEGGVGYTALIVNATPFVHAEAAKDAVQDHCGGLGVVFSCYQLEAR
jgi:hypothetical protein